MSLSLRPPTLTEGNLDAVPFAHLMLAACERRFAGSLVLWSGDQPFAENAAHQRILIEGGIAVAADLGGSERSLLAAMIPLTVRRAGGYRFLPKVDVVGHAPHVLRGHVDPFMLLATALRGPVREDAIDQVVLETNGRVLRLRPGCPYERFGLNRDEWAFLQELRRRPAAAPGLMARSDGPEHFTKRMIYLLRVTGMVSVLPVGQSPESRAISIPGPPPPVTGAGAITARPARQTQRARPAREAAHAGHTDDREHTDTVALFSPDAPFSKGAEQAPPEQPPTEQPTAEPVDPRPAFARVPSQPPPELSGDLAYRYREVVRHHRRMRSRNLFEILGVGPEDCDDTIEDAYAVLEVQWRSDHLPPALAVLRPLVEEILEGLAEARDTLTHPRRRYEYIERLRRGDARLLSLCQLEDEECPRDARETRPLRPSRLGRAG